MNKTALVFQWDAQPFQLCQVLCSLMEAQSLVDLTILCNQYQVKVHKCVLAASSSYFRECLQKDPAIDKVVLNGLKQNVVKALIEYMYCGETSISQEYVKETVDAANYLGIPGLSNMSVEKFSGNALQSPTDGNLETKPPLFFSKNDKSKYYFKEKEIFEKNLKFMVENNDYPLLEPLKRRRTALPKFNDEAQLVLAKEEAASRQALEILQKDLNSSGNVFYIDDTCTEATVQTGVNSEFDQSQLMQVQEYVVNSCPKNSVTLLRRSAEHGGSSAQNRLHTMKGIQLETKRPPIEQNQTQNVYEIKEIQGNVPVIYKTADGNFLNMGNQLLDNLNLANHQNIEYHVIPSENNANFQQYISNNFDEFPVEIQNSLPEEIVNNPTKKESNDEEKNLEKNQLTLISDYDPSRFEPSYSGNVSLVENISDGPIIEISSEIDTSKLNGETVYTDKQFVANYPLTYNSKDDHGGEVNVASEMLRRRKRGRPPKRKFFMESVTQEQPNVSLKGDFILDEKRPTFTKVVEFDDSLKMKQMVSSEQNKFRGSNQAFNMYSKPMKPTLTVVNTSNQLTEEYEKNAPLMVPVSVSSRTTPLNKDTDNSDDNDKCRRYTRSVFKFN